MALTELFDRLVKHLTDTYECHTVILYGSYVSGDYTEESDIDIVCFSDRDGDYNDVEVFEGKQLDVWVYPTSKLSEIESFLRVHGGKVLRDDRELADTFLNSITTLFDAGTRKLTDDEKVFLTSWLEKMYVRSKKNDVEGNYRLVWMLKDALEIYFELAGRWYLGPKKSLRWLRENDSRAYVLFDRVYRRDVNEFDVERLIAYLKTV